MMLNASEKVCYVWATTAVKTLDTGYLLCSVVCHLLGSIKSDFMRQLKKIQENEE